MERRAGTNLVLTKEEALKTREGERRERARSLDSKPIQGRPGLRLRRVATDRSAPQENVGGL